MEKTAVILYTLLSVSNPATIVEDVNMPDENAYVQNISTNLLATKKFSLEDRYDNNFVNSVFKDNILLTLNYMSGIVQNKSDISWDKIEVPRTYIFSLQPGETFAFHDQILPKYKENVVKTTNSHFNYQDGFKSDGYLTGDGVCHLASLLYWASQDAGLTTYAPTNHDFAIIKDVPKQYGVSIYNLPGSFDISARQNLYIKNDFDKPVTFIFNYDGRDLRIDIKRSNT